MTLDILYEFLMSGLAIFRADDFQGLRTNFKGDFVLHVEKFSVVLNREVITPDDHLFRFEVLLSSLQKAEIVKRKTDGEFEPAGFKESDIQIPIIYPGKRSRFPAVTEVTGFSDDAFEKTQIQ